MGSYPARSAGEATSREMRICERWSSRCDDVTVDTSSLAAPLQDSDAMGGPHDPGETAWSCDE